MRDAEPHSKGPGPHLSSGYRYLEGIPQSDSPTPKMIDYSKDAKLRNLEDPYLSPMEHSRGGPSLSKIPLASPTDHSEHDGAKETVSKFSSPADHYRDSRYKTLTNALALSDSSLMDYYGNARYQMHNEALAPVP